VLDASALLALLHNESGAPAVAAALPTAVMSAVNWSEVRQKLVARGSTLTRPREQLEALGLQILPFTADDADAAALLWSSTSHLGLSLGDRACLALGLRLTLPILTADRVWTGLALPIHVTSIR
jgi:PIN domain nuclease of toxin-antitoxin system